MKPRDYHNENNAFAAQWTRNLMRKGLIPDGFVDERDIRDVQPMDLWGFTRCHFFSGSGGWAMALRLAGAPDDLPLWTGSCPCQPFSVAGQQKGFADERHLWPAWQKLIAQSRPAIVLGEQVAGASAWLRLVRSDLETLGYAVGAIPVEAASAGAYHLRDRFWFVAYSKSEQARPAGQPRQRGDVGNSASFAEREPFDQADAATAGWETRRISSSSSSASALADDDDARLQGRRLQSERTDQQPARPDGMADAPGTGPFPGTLAGIRGSEESPRPRNVEPERRGGGDVPYPERIGLRSERPGAALGAPGGVQGADGQRERLRPDAGTVCDDREFEWVLGADGKARRVKPGIRLLAHGIPNRASKLRAYGNAIDLRPAAAFIEAALACRP